jgi:hypothetical protein
MIQKKKKSDSHFTKLYRDRDSVFKTFWCFQFLKLKKAFIILALEALWPTTYLYKTSMGIICQHKIMVFFKYL